MLKSVASRQGRRSLNWLVLLMSLGAVFTMRVAVSQEADQEKKAAAAKSIPLNLNERQFNIYVVGNSYAFGSTPYQERLQWLLDTRIAEIQRVRDLTEAEAAQLKQVGQDDLKRFIDQVEEKRRKLQDKPYTRSDARAIFEELDPLHEKLIRGLFLDGSQFADQVNQLLDAEEQKRLAEIDRDRIAYQYASAIDQDLLRIGREVGLSDSQREKLRALILQETRVPRRVSDRGGGSQIVHARLSQIPEEKLQPLFSEVQWPLMQYYLEGGRRMLPYLQNKGVLDADENE